MVTHRQKRRLSVSIEYGKAIIHLDGHEYETRDDVADLQKKDIRAFANTHRLNRQAERRLWRMVRQKQKTFRPRPRLHLFVRLIESLYNTKPDP